MDMSDPLTVVGLVLTGFIVLMVLGVVLEFLSHPIRFLAKIVMKVAGVLFAVLAMFQAGDLVNGKGWKWDAVAVMAGCALVGALCEWLIVRPSLLERRATEREAIERRQNAEHEKWKRYQDERHDWEWERDRTIWKDGNEELR